MQTPKSEQIWLALEDIWVQRAMLEPIREVNDNTAAFTPVADPKSTPLKKQFRSRIWDLTIEVADPGPNQGTAKVLKAKLKNRTGQLQLLGVGNTMRLLVWLDNNTNAQPYWFEIQGEFIGGEQEVDVPYIYTHSLPPGIVATEISKVVQQLDERTVPIRRLDRLVLGYRSSKHEKTELQNPKFWAEDAAAASTGLDGGAIAGGRGGGGDPGGEGSGSTNQGGRSGGVSAPGGVGPGGITQTGGPAGILDGNKKRYLEVTDQVRRHAGRPGRGGRSDVHPRRAGCVCELAVPVPHGAGALAAFPRRSGFEHERGRVWRGRDHIGRRHARSGRGGVWRGRSCRLGPASEWGRRAMAGLASIRRAACRAAREASAAAPQHLRGPGECRAGRADDLRRDHAVREVRREEGRGGGGDSEDGRTEAGRGEA